MASGAKLEFVSASQPEAIRVDVSNFKIIKPPLAANLTRLGDEESNLLNFDDGSDDEEFQPFSDSVAESTEDSSLVDNSSSMEDSEKSDTDESSASEDGGDEGHSTQKKSRTNYDIISNGPDGSFSMQHSTGQEEPHSSDSQSSDHSVPTSCMFYDVNENPHDKGTRAPQRIYKSWSPGTRSPVGLENRGVTCYQNAAVQTLLHLPALGRYLLEVLKGMHPKVSKSSVTVELANLFKKLMERKTPLFPARLLHRLGDINPMLDEWQQEDSHEYYMSLISRLQEDSVPRGEKLRSSILHDIFGGSVEQKVTCEQCKTVSTTTQDFYDLPVSFSQSQSKHHYSLEKSIHDFFTPELIAPYKEKRTSSNSLSNDTQSEPELSDSSSDTSYTPNLSQQEVGGYQCEICKAKTRAIKRINIAEAPEYLTIHIKRFKMDGKISKKLKDTMTYPLEMSLTRYEKDKMMPLLYKLVGVILHEGRTVSSGHYIALTRQPSNEWVMYDDETVRIIPESQVISNPSAYILVYSRLLARPQRKSPKATADTIQPQATHSQNSSKPEQEQQLKINPLSKLNLLSKPLLRQTPKSNNKLIVPLSPQKEMPLSNGQKLISIKKTENTDKRNSIDDIFNNTKRRKK